MNEAHAQQVAEIEAFFVDMASKEPPVVLWFNRKVANGQIKIEIENSAIDALRIAASSIGMSVQDNALERADIKEFRYQWTRADSIKRAALIVAMVRKVRSWPSADAED